MTTKPIIKLTKKQAIKTHKIKLNYKGAGMFLHCKHCLSKYLKARKKNNGVSKESPRGTIHYEASDYVFTYPNGIKANILVIWCKTCGRSIWDSRHLTNLY